MKKYVAIALIAAGSLTAFTRQGVINDLLAQTEIMQLDDNVEKYPKIIESAYTTFLESVGESYPTRARYAMAIHTAAQKLVTLYNEKREEFSSVPSYATSSPPALLIGIDYQGTDAEQEGAVYDTEHLMDHFLRGKLGYREENVVLMTDKEESSPLLPTRSNIERKLTSFCQKANEAKEGYFHYSGLSEDGSIEPTDHSKTGNVDSREILQKLKGEIGKGVTVTLTMDLPSKPLLPFAWNASGEYLQRANRSKEKEPKIVAITLSEESEGGRGGLTKALLSTMKEYNYSITYRQLLAGMKSHMEKFGLKQSPQLSSNSSLDLDDYFLYNHVRLRPQKEADKPQEQKITRRGGAMETPVPVKEKTPPAKSKATTPAPKADPQPKMVSKTSKSTRPSVIKKPKPKFAKKAPAKKKKPAAKKAPAKKKKPASKGNSPSKHAQKKASKKGKPRKK